MANKYVPKLLKSLVTNLRNPQKAFMLGDAVMEHVIPPFSILAALSGLSLLGSLLWWHTERIQGGSTQLLSTNQPELSKINLVLSISAIVGQVLYLFVGLKMVNSPRAVYRLLIFAPAYIVWKIWHYVRVLFGFEQHKWVRTARNED
jgi:hypothetical protein